MTATATKKPIESVNMDELEAILERARESLSEEEHRKLKAAVETLAYLTSEIEDRKTTIRHLRNLLFGSKSEKTEDVLAEEPKEGAASTGKEDTDGSGAATDSRGEEGTAKKKRKGHGRNGAEKYVGAETIEVAHESLKAGDSCPEQDCRGKVYRLADPRVLVRLVGQPPVGGKVYKLERLRCNLCLTIYTAKPPEGIGEKKYDATTAAMVALLKYGSGLPFNRLARLEGSLGIPLPPATQWDIVSALAQLLDPVYRELIRWAAQGEVLHNDDTTMKILEFMGKRREKRELEGDDVSTRTGIFTSGIVSIVGGQRIALFFTARKHAGENLERVLKERASELGAPIQMCDALTRNVPREFAVIVANCMAHARRRFVDVAESFPAECRFVLETLRDVYKNDALTKEKGLSPEERMRFHRTESWPLINELRHWLKKQLREKLVEPNSGLGTAISYMLEHWKKLTRFLRTPGAPLDNNLAERALKKAILHRKSALFYKTQNGARVGDLFMTLIHSCELSGVNPFEYLTALQRHVADFGERPAEWLPWTYRETLTRATAEPS